MATSGLRPILVRGLQALKLNRLAHRVYYRYVHGFESGQKEVQEALERCFDHLRSHPTLAPGDYFEFGVFKGYTFWYAQKTAIERGQDSMRFFGCDSFAGLPDIGEVDATENDEFYTGQYHCSRQQVTKNLESKNVDWDRTFLVEGYFDRSLTEELKRKFDVQQISVGLIDCDLYSSTVDVLNFASDLLVNGSILLFDDWNSFGRSDERGQRRAFREFLDANPSIRARPFFDYGHYGQVFLIERET